MRSSSRSGRFRGDTVEDDTRRWLLLIAAGAWVLASVLVAAGILALGSEDEDVAAVGRADGAGPLSFATAPTPSLSAGTGSRVRPAADGQASRITLSASPRRAGLSQSITLEGRYPGGDGSTVRVQRQQGRWIDFPVSADVEGGKFSTFVETARSGVSKFRVVDSSTGIRSNVVSVTIRR
jgi:hypothetical protein